MYARERVGILLGSLIRNWPVFGEGDSATIPFSRGFDGGGGCR
jgi:hypothetical protein